MGEGPVRVWIERARTRSGRDRAIARLGGADALVYERSVVAVVLTVERALGDAVLAERVAGRGAIAWTRPEPWRPARRGFREALTASGASGADAILRTDVLDCYRSIAPPSVDRALAALGCGRADRAPILRFLERCEAAGLRGLPVGPTPSAVLANAVLAPVDAAIEGRGLRHVRWVDDVLVALPAGVDAASVLDHVAGELGLAGLRPNLEKTDVLEPGATPTTCSGLRRVR